MKTKTFFCCLIIFFLNIIFVQAQETNPEHIKNLNAILKKPIPSGSMLRYEKLVEYISKSLDQKEAAHIMADIQAKNTFGKYFYERLSYSTVDKKILPLLRQISNGSESSITEIKPPKAQPKSTSSTSKKDYPVKKGGAGTIPGKLEINSDHIFIARRYPFTVAFPNREVYKNVSEEDIMNAVFQNQPEGVNFERKGDYTWQLKGLENVWKFLEFIDNKEHYFVPHLARELFLIDPNLISVNKINKDEFQINYAKNFHLGFTSLELLEAITKNNKLPEGMNIKELAPNHWSLKISERSFLQAIIDSSIGFDLSEFEESFANKISSAAK